MFGLLYSYNDQRKYLPQEMLTNNGHKICFVTPLLLEGHIDKCRILAWVRPHAVPTPDCDSDLSSAA